MTINNDMFHSFGSLLKGFRKRRHLSQQQLARAMGVHRNAIGRWEQGDFLPATKGMVLELARHLALDQSETRQLLEASLTALSPYWLVPFSRNPFFTGREEILQVLHTQLDVERSAALTQSSALCGLGGVGKTQIALEYAYQYALDYSAIFWIEAETSETAISSLWRIAELLQLPEGQETDQQRVVIAVQHWLSSHSGWLLIWDNLEDLELLPRLLPTARQGAVLLTTRSQALGTLAWGMNLAPMEQREGMMFVLRRAKMQEPEATDEHMQQLAVQQPDEYAAASELVTIMGGLPLALDQAGAYIEETNCGIEGYLRRYKQQRLHLLDRRGVVHSDHPDSVVATLRLACQHVAQQHPAALELLRFCAFLYPEAIYEKFLVVGAAHLGPGLESVVVDVSQFDAALATLRSFSLVQRQPEIQMLSLHRLIQVILREEMSEEEQAEFQQRAVHLLHAVFPEITPVTFIETRELCEQLLPHVMTCVATIPKRCQDQELATVLLRAAFYLHWRGQNPQAESLYWRALSLFEELLGSEHPQVGFTLNRLAELHRDLGKHEQAKLLFQQAIRILEQALGSEHLEVSRPLGGLAIVYKELGQYEQAEPLYQRALRIREQAWSFVHHDVAVALNNLGIFYRELGQYAQAEPLYQRALHIFEQALGSEHPKVAYPLIGLAVLYREQGKYKEAEPLFQRVLQIREQHLGQNHPETAQTLHDLALFRKLQGNVSEASSLAEQALQIRSQFLGDTHPKTIASRTLYVQLVEARGNIQGGASFTHCAEEHSDQVRTAHLQEEALITPQKANDFSPSESDPLLEFLSACCELHPHAWCRSADLWEAYKRWVQQYQEHFPLSRHAFTMQLKAHGCRPDRTNTARIWRGIALMKQEP